ncbi:MAG: sodium-translocating pyrophosphatase, partial [Alistipes dispar]
MNTPSIFWLVPAASLVALAVAWIFYSRMKREDEGTERMREIAAHVRKGAMAYLRQQYKVVLVVFLVLALFFAYLAYGAGVQNPWVPFAFLTGGFFSGLAGFFGMKTATYASARTANAARQSLDRGLKVAFRSGAVMGLVVVGLGLLDISFWYLILDRFTDVAGPQKLVVITTTMLTFGMGASTQALFARVGGGIYTKAADVGADLVGKVEAGIPEDDPRNPATIADNVGDNVGDVAGMGADLYESYCGSVLATAALGAAAFASAGSETLQLKAVLAPMLIAAVGILLSIVGIFLVRTKEGASMRELLRSLGVGVNFSSALIALATFGILYLLGIENWLGLSFSVITGLAAGIVIGQATEYYTSHSYKPTQKIAGSAKTGPATVIIAGVGSGMISTAIPVVTIGAAIVLAYLCATGFDIEHMMQPHNLSQGLYGIGIAAVGMLSTLGITLATDAYGPIADNAGGNAEMSGLGPEVRKRTDALDALGNTTAATGKGFAIGSAALTALALL